jgi:hypothetical protein
MPGNILESGIRKNNTKIEDKGNVFVVTLHGTVIFKDYGNHCHLYTGGYNTATTIRRINECLCHRGYAMRVNKASFNLTDTLIFWK